MVTEATDKPILTPDQLKAWASNLATDDGFRELVRTMKGDIVRAWGNQPDAEKREELYRDLHAVARLEAKVQTLAEALTIDNRKKAKRE